MDYFLNEQQKMMRSLARQIAEEKILPVRAEYDEKEIFPWLQKAALNQADRTSDSLAFADQYDDSPEESPAAALVRRGLVSPLGVSRSWLVAHGSLAGLQLAFDGTPLLAGLGIAAEVAETEATP